jgi:hypothetical protein
MAKICAMKNFEPLSHFHRLTILARGPIRVSMSWGL